MRAILLSHDFSPVCIDLAEDVIQHTSLRNGINICHSAIAFVAKFDKW